MLAELPRSASGAPKIEFFGKVEQMHWYTADTHFGHDNIIRYCDRPFSTSRDMDARIVDNMRQRVAKNDDLWIVGDFAYGERRRDMSYLMEIFEALPGRKHLVIGNHDGPETLKLPWKSIERLVELKDMRGRPKNTLCHYPMLTWNGFNRGGLQLFGHVHEKWRGTRKSVNVGVDVWDFRPVKFEEIESRASGQPELRYWDVVETVDEN